MKFKIGDKIEPKKPSSKASGTINGIEGRRYVIEWDNRPFRYEFDTLYNHYEIIDSSYELSLAQIRDNRIDEILK